MPEKEFVKIAPEDPPTVDQLFRLAAAHIAPLEGLIPHKKAGRAYMWSRKLIDPGQFNEFGIRHTVYGRIGRGTLGAIATDDDQTEFFIPSRSWSLKYMETYLQRVSPTTWVRDIAIYQFEWSHQDVTVAQRTRKVLESISTGDIPASPSREIAQRALSANLFRVNTVKNDVATVTESDCETLIKAVNGEFYTGPIHVGAKAA